MLQIVDELESARSVEGAGARHAAIRDAGRALRRRLLAAEPVVCARTFEIMSVVYPTRFAFWGAALVPSAFVTLVHRVLLLQFRSGGELRTLLFNPSDPHGILRAPYVQHLRARYKRFARLGYDIYAPLEDQLRAIGIRPEDIDLVAFDHFHLQDLRSLLGTRDGRFQSRFPRATLIAQRREWNQWEQLHPIQRAFFVRDGRKDAVDDRVTLIDDDVALADSVVLIRTPGHTSGNQTLFFNAGGTIWGVSENGVCADNWSPEASSIRGIATRVGDQELEVLLNLDTPEGGGEHYTSMVLEKTVVDPVPEHPAFVQMQPSFEATSSFVTPGIRPTYEHGGIRAGAPLRTTPPPHVDAFHAGA